MLFREKWGANFASKYCKKAYCTQSLLRIRSQRPAKSFKNSRSATRGGPHIVHLGSIRVVRPVYSPRTGPAHALGADACPTQWMEALAVLMSVLLLCQSSPEPSRQDLSAPSARTLVRLHSADKAAPGVRTNHGLSPVARAFSKQCLIDPMCLLVDVPDHPACTLDLRMRTAGTSTWCACCKTAVPHLADALALLSACSSPNTVLVDCRSPVPPMAAG